MQRGGSAYILTNKHNTTLYTGSAEDLFIRIQEHVTKRYTNSFTASYNLNKLVFYKHFGRIEEAREYERYIKGKSRKWKKDLYQVLILNGRISLIVLIKTTLGTLRFGWGLRSEKGSVVETLPSYCVRRTGAPFYFALSDVIG